MMLRLHEVEVLHEAYSQAMKKLRA
jgi:hypothetical protein